MLKDTDEIIIGRVKKRLIDVPAHILLDQIDDCDEELRQYIVENRASLDLEMKNIILQHEE